MLFEHIEKRTKTSIVEKKKRKKKSEKSIFFQIKIPRKL